MESEIRKFPFAASLSSRWQGLYIIQDEVFPVRQCHLCHAWLLAGGNDRDALASGGLSRCRQRPLPISWLVHQWRGGEHSLHHARLASQPRAGASRSTWFQCESIAVIRRWSALVSISPNSCSSRKTCINRASACANWRYHINTVREEQRGRIAQRLHDVVGGLLTSMKLDIQQVVRRTEDQEIIGIRCWF